jgi:hypothetical protein
MVGLEDLTHPTLKEGKFYAKLGDGGRRVWAALGGGVFQA